MIAKEFQDKINQGARDSLIESIGHVAPNFVKLGYNIIVDVNRVIAAQKVSNVIYIAMDGDNIITTFESIEDCDSYFNLIWETLSKVDTDQ